MLTQRALPLVLFVCLTLAVLILPAAPLAAQPEPANLLRNGDFERGSVAPWEGIGPAQLTTAEVHSGRYAVRITGQEASQGWLIVQPGATYVLTAWFRWTQFSGTQWGDTHLTVQDANWQTVAAIEGLHTRVERDRWHKLALTFTPTTDRIRVAFGVFGPQDEVELYFDDMALVVKRGNRAPTAAPVASTSAGRAPLAIAFDARADDRDGAVALYRWRFGDGAESRSPKPTHVFRARGAYTVTLDVWDDQGALTSATLKVTVSDPSSPTISITAPVPQEQFATDRAALALAGRADTPSGRIVSIVWDNLRTGEAGAVAVDVGPAVNWTTPSIALAPGLNEILVSAVDTRGRTHTDRLFATRQVSGPRIYDIRAAAQAVPMYERYQVGFQLDTVSAFPLFSYDEQPPPGVAPGIGVTVEGVITTPSGRTVRQPAFYRNDAVRRGDGAGAFYELTTASGWSLRYAPQERGLHRVSLRAHDASGIVEVEAGSFTAGPARRQGFIGVSPADTRYFSFSNGDLFWPVGPAWAVDNQGGRGFNFDRPWLGGLGIYSTNWARWKSTAQTQGNEGFSSQLSYLEPYPGHELSQELFYPEGYRMWLSCFGDDQFCPRIQPNTDYQIKLRVKVVDLAGPRDADQPFGLVAKLHGWPEEPGFDADNRAARSLFPRISVDREWHTVVAIYRTAADEGVGQARGDLSLYLENVTAGRAYIDELSLREVLPGGALGPELIRNPRADLHTYVEQRPAAFIDEQLEQGEAAGLFYKYVVHDKNDWIQNHLLGNGIFAERGDGYYQPQGTKAHWLLQQWWRYIAARWGSSTAVHSWELNNEGPPDDGSGDHARMAQAFARFMRANDAHPHLASTSFWCCWRPTFWGDRARFPDLGYADIHEYPSLEDRFADGTPVVYDEARYQAETSIAYGADRVGVPIVRGELGFAGEPVFDYLTRPNPGVWFHNLLWAQLNHGAVFDPGYWFSEHFGAIDAAAHARPFAAFVATLDVQRGGYDDIAAQVSNPELRVYGQRNPARGKAHLWVQNRRHTWRNVMGVERPAPITPQSGTVTLTLRPNERYVVEWWDTYRGTVTRREPMASGADGRLTLRITALARDLALRVGPE